MMMYYDSLSYADALMRAFAVHTGAKSPFWWNKCDFGEKAILRKAIWGECLEWGDFEAVDFWIEGDFCPSV